MEILTQENARLKESTGKSEREAEMLNQKATILEVFDALSVVVIHAYVLAKVYLMSPTEYTFTSLIRRKMPLRQRRLCAFILNLT